MKALTLHGVWAWCIMHAGKNVENRSWTPPLKLIGKRLAIHAGQNAGDASSQERYRHLRGGPKLYPKGVILGTVVLKGFVDDDNIVGLSAKEARQISRSEWASGSCLWVLDAPRLLADPVSCKGALGLWEVPDQIAIQLDSLAPTPGASSSSSESSRPKRNDKVPGTASRRKHRAHLLKEVQLDGNMPIGQLEGSYAEAIAALLGSPVEDVRSRIQSAPKKMKLSTAFHETWPDRHTELGNWTVEFAFERVAIEEISDQFGLSFRTVERRLEKADRDEKVKVALKSR